MSTLFFHATKQEYRALCRQFSRSAKWKDGSNVYASSATERFRINRNVVSIDSKDQEYVMKQYGPPEPRQEKRYIDISAVPFSRPATSLFRDNLEMKKSRSLPEYKFDEKIGDRAPDRRGTHTHIVNLELGNDQLQSKSMSSVDQNNNGEYSSSKVMAIFGISLGVFLMVVSLSNQDWVALTVPSAGDPVVTADSGPSVVPRWLVSELPSVKER